MPEEKIAQYAMQNKLSLTAITPCEWLISWLTVNQQEMLKNFLLPSREVQNIKRLSILAIAKNEQTFFVGERARQFLQVLNEKIQTRQDCFAQTHNYLPEKIQNLWQSLLNQSSAFPPLLPERVTPKPQLNAF